MEFPDTYTTFGMLGLILGLFIGVPLASLVSAVFLRFALWSARVRGVWYETALVATTVANFILLAFGMMFWSTAAYSLTFDENPQMSISYWFSPFVFFYYVVGLVLMHATIFCQMLSDGEEPLRFNKSVFVSLIYVAISFGASSLATLIFATLHAVETLS